MNIIPVINCPDWECLDKKLRLLEEKLPEADWVHLDIADGRFTFNKSWNDPAAWVRRNHKFQTEVHLMAEEPERSAEEWLKAGAKRLIVHLESMSEPEKGIRELKTLCHARGAELMLAVNPETPISKLQPYLSEINEVQVFAQAYPGPAGQKFLPVTLERIKNLRELAPNATIEVDGGIEPATAAQIKAAGADIAVSGSYIFKSSDPTKAYAELSAI